MCLDFKDSGLPAYALEIKPGYWKINMSLLVIDRTNCRFLTVPLEDEGMETIELLVGEVETILSKRMKQQVSVVTITVGDRRLTEKDWDRAVDYYLLDGDAWSVLVSSPYQQLFIRTLPGRTRSLEFHPCETVEQIKAKIEKMERVTCSEQLLTYAGRLLRDECTLADYDIHRGSTIELNIELPGGTPPTTMNKITIPPEPCGKGVPFADVANSSGWERRQWSRKAPKWRTAQKGLCIEGICKNRQCSAYKKKIIMNLGFEEFDLIEDSHECKCPMCKQHITPLTFGVNNCKWMYVGKKVVNSAQRPVTVRQDWKVADDAYHTLNVDTGGKASWLRLKFRARSLEERFPKCNICLANITSHPVKLSCSHKYHAPCIDNWRRDNISCPICEAVCSRTPLMRRAGG